MKLSIITINYNNRDGLEKTIDSVICQTWRDFEWIVIDGGSTDGSKELIEKYQNRFAYWCSEPDKGVYSAMNKGIANAKGEYLNFMNSGDCYYDSNVLYDVFCHKTICEDFIVGNSSYVNKNGREVRRRCPPQHLTAAFLYKTSPCHQSVFIKHSLFEKALYDVNLKYVSDWKHIFYNIVILNSSYVIIDRFIVKYDNSGISSVDLGAVAEERKKVLEQYLPHLVCKDFDTYTDEYTLCLKRIEHRKLFDFVQIILSKDKWLKFKIFIYSLLFE